MGFEWPWAFLLLPLPVLLWLKRRVTRDASAIDLPPSVIVALQRLDQQQNNHTRWPRWLLAGIAWLALVTAITQPYKQGSGVAQPASGRALALLIDLSTSMERRDFTMDNEPVDRLSVVKHIAGQFINTRQGDRIGLVLFGSEAFIASPLSYDLQAVNAVLQSSGIGMAGRTTAIGDALGLAIKSLRDDPSPDKAIVLLSDGTNNAGSAEPEDAAALASSLGIVVHTIGLGSDASTNASQQFQSAAADLDEATLKSIAQGSGGEFFRAQTTEQLATIYQQINKLQNAEVIAPPLIIKQHLGNLFVFVLLCCMLLLAVHDWRQGHTA